MLEIRELTDGGFVVRNILTNHLLQNRRGDLLVFKTPKKAAKYICKINNKLGKAVAGLRIL